MDDDHDDEILRREELREKKEEERRDKAEILRSDKKETDERRFQFRRRRTLSRAGIGKEPKRPKTVRCLRCKTKIDVPPRGRLPDFCSPSCRQRAYEQRKYQRPTLVEALARDIATVQGRDMLRAMIWDLLKQAGLVDEPSPPPAPPSPKKKKADLRIVKPDGSRGTTAPTTRRPPWD
jgi:hypothetical protein